MSNPKRHHWVPRCIQKEFADQKHSSPEKKIYKVWVFSKDGKQKRLQNIYEVFTCNHMYTLKINGEKNYTAETKFLQKIESEYSSIFKNKIKSKTPLNEEEHIRLCKFVYAQLQRTKRKKENFQQFVKELIPESKNPEELKDYLQNHYVKGIINALPDITSLLYKMNLSFLCIDDKNKDYFILSDDPCVLFNSDLQWQEFHSPGLKQKNIQLTLPLSPKITLCMSWTNNVRGYIEIKRKTMGGIDDLNRLTCRFCDEKFISPKPKTKKIWFSKYPFSILFMLKVLKHKIKEIIFKLKHNPLINP